MRSDVYSISDPSPSHTKTYKKSKKYIKSKKQAYNRYIADAIGEMREMDSQEFRKAQQDVINAMQVVTLSYEDIGAGYTRVMKFLRHAGECNPEYSRIADNIWYSMAPFTAYRVVAWAKSGFDGDIPEYSKAMEILGYDAELSKARKSKLFDDI